MADNTVQPGASPAKLTRADKIALTFYAFVVVALCAFPTVVELAGGLAG